MKQHCVLLMLVLVKSLKNNMFKLLMKKIRCCNKIFINQLHLQGLICILDIFVCGTFSFVVVRNFVMLILRSLMLCGYLLVLFSNSIKGSPKFGRQTSHNVLLISVTLQLTTPFLTFFRKCQDNDPLIGLLISLVHTPCSFMLSRRGNIVMMHGLPLHQWVKLIMSHY